MMPAVPMVAAMGVTGSVDTPWRPAGKLKTSTVTGPAVTG